MDLLVVGSGAAGMTAALVAAEEGLSVLLREKHAQVGGTTAPSGGTLWIPGNSQAARAGIPDPVERGRAYLEREIGNHIRRDLLDAFLESGPRAVDYLEARTAVCFDPARGHVALGASFARPGAAGRHRGERCRSAIRERGGFLPRFRRGHVALPKGDAEHTGLADLRPRDAAGSA